MSEIINLLLSWCKIYRLLIGINNFSLLEIFVTEADDDKFHLNNKLCKFLNLFITNFVCLYIFGYKTLQCAINNMQCSSYNNKKNISLMTLCLLKSDMMRELLYIFEKLNV